MPELPEQRSRERIDAQRERCGWAVQTGHQINLSAQRDGPACELSFATGEPDCTLFVDAICTIQRLHSILRGEELAEGADDLSGAELAKALGKGGSGVSPLNTQKKLSRDGSATLDVACDPAVPIEKFDFIVTDECHRSTCKLWRQVLEYFDASPTSLSTEPDDSGYAPEDLDRSVVVPDPIRTVLRACRDAVQTELFPGRTLVPKTLIFAKDDSHAGDIVHLCREVFGKGNDFCKKITYQAKHPVTSYP